jgi:dynein heavy chain, axonemal
MHEPVIGIDMFANFMLVQVSNEIISRCCEAIKLPEVFSPNVTNVSAVLQQCIKAGNKWKALYQQTAAAVTAKSAHPWDFSETRVFAHVDAFIQRCADLLEVSPMLPYVCSLRL